MRGAALLFFLCLLVLILSCIVLYQRFAFRIGIQAELKHLHQKLKEIQDTDSEERILLFTENKELMELAAQMNRLLESRIKVKADHRRFEMASKRMLSNISHDIKTPMTVVLGYLEIMRISGEALAEMLAKMEQKAQDVIELIDQFFTLAKIEAGDMDLEITRVDICEICRESILDLYEILTKADFQVAVAVPESPVYVQGNREAQQRILCNLISNVIRYGSDGRYLVILAGVLCLFVFALAYLGIADDPDTGVPDAAPGNGTISAPIELFTSMSFLVFTGVMLSSFIVSAYKNRTMNLMFSYPIRRQKILLSQMLAVWIFNFTALVLTKLLLYGCILNGSRFMVSSFPIDFDMTALGFYVQLIVKSIVIVTMGFIALFIGMAMKSSKATIISSFLLILLTQANIGDFTMADNGIFPAFSPCTWYIILNTRRMTCITAHGYKQSVPELSPHE